MNPLSRLLKSVRQAGLGGTFAKLLCPYFDRKFDRDHGTETCAIRERNTLDIQSENKDFAARYEPSRVLPLRRMLPLIRRQLPEGSVLLDFGCGKGRVLLLAAEHGFPARGVEFSGELCGVAERNVRAFNARTGNTKEISVIPGDVTQYAVRPDEQVFFLFHPFAPPVFERVLDNLASSLSAHPRKMLIVVYLPSAEYHQAITARPEFELASRHRFWGCNFSVYATR
jgi:SAM-dependent methyltransferase